MRRSTQTTNKINDGNGNSHIGVGDGTIRRRQEPPPQRQRKGGTVSAKKIKKFSMSSTPIVSCAVLATFIIFAAFSMLLLAQFAVRGNPTVVLPVEAKRNRVTGDPNDGENQSSKAASLQESASNVIKPSVQIKLTTTTETTVVECMVSTPHYNGTSSSDNDNNDNNDFVAPDGTIRIAIRNKLIRRSGSSAEAFLKLVDEGFYTNMYTFRVIRGFVVQFGFKNNKHETKFDYAKRRIREVDTNVTDSGGGEPPVLLSNTRGTVTMIAGPTGQVFINLGNNKRLDRDGTIPFGMLDEPSMRLVENIYSYKPGMGQIPALQSNTVATKFPKMSRIDECYRSGVKSKQQKGQQELILSMQ